MTSIIGIFALAVCMFVPGLLALELFRIRLSAFAAGAIAVGLSFTLNHFFVITLVVLGAYRRNIVLGFIACELTVLVAVIIFNATRSAYTASPSRSASAPVSLAVLIAIALLTYVFWTFGSMAFSDFGEIFTSWDTVVSWNKWASEWAAGALPLQTFEYPQLLPTLWSLVYVILGGSELQVFAKALTAWLPMVMFLVFADIAAKGRILTATVAAFFCLKLLMLFGSFSMSGYADFPAAVLSFLAFYIAVSSTDRHRISENGQWVLGAVIASGAALTKQSGVFFAIIYPLVLWLLSPYQSARIWKSALILFFLVLPWYAYRFYAIKFAGEISNIAQTTQLIHAGRTYPERLWHGMDLLLDVIHGPLLWAGIGLLLGALCSRFGRILVLAVVLPYLLIYGLFFSYDIRNAIPALPFAAWAMGVGARNTLRLLKIQRFISRPLAYRLIETQIPLPHWLATRAWPSALIFIVLVSCSAFSWAGAWPSGEALLADQNRRLMLLGNPAINRAVIAFIEQEHPSGKILTNDYLLGAIPAVRPYYMAFLMGPWTTEQDLNYMIKSFSISAILASDGAAAHLGPTFDRWIAEGRMVVRAGSPETWILAEVRPSHP